MTGLRLLSFAVTGFSSSCIEVGILGLGWDLSLCWRSRGVFVLLYGGYDGYRGRNQYWCLDLFVGFQESLEKKDRVVELDKERDLFVVSWACDLLLVY